MSPNADLACACGFQAASENALKIHQGTHPSGVHLKCPKCPRTFLRRPDYDEHVKSHVGKAVKRRKASASKALTNSETVPKKDMARWPTKRMKGSIYTRTKVIQGGGTGVGSNKQKGRK